jgi:hypothetical protein
MTLQTKTPHLTVVSSQCSGRTLYCESRDEHKLKALDNYYTAERRSGTDALTAYDRMCAFGDDYDRLTALIAEQMGASQ